MYDSADAIAEIGDFMPMMKYSRCLAHAHNSWLVDPEDVRSEATRVRIYDLWSPGTAWVPREDIATFAELRQVSECWPVRSLVIENGDAEPGKIEFRTSGAGILTNRATQTRLTQVSTWFAGGVYSVRYNRQSRNFYDRGQLEVAWGSIDPEAGTSIHRAAWIARDPEDRFPRLDLKPQCTGYGPR
jgi:hypothetical protein